MPSWCAEKSCSIKQEKISWLIKFLSLPLAGWGRVLLEPGLRCGAACQKYGTKTTRRRLFMRLLYYCLYLALLYKIHRSIKSYIICCKSWLVRSPANRLRVSMQRYFMAP
jgi:hypothetical protein